MAHRPAQVTGADEERVHAGNADDFLEPVQGARAFDLDDHADPLVGDLEVVLDRTEARAPAHGGHAAHTLRRVFGRGNGGLGLGAVLHERIEQRLNACVQHALDHDGVVPRHPGHGDHARAGYGLQHVDQCHQVQWRVLHVDHGPVKAGTTHGLGDHRRGGHEPGANGVAGWQIRTIEQREKWIVHQNMTGSGRTSVLSRKSKSQPSCA